MNIFQFFRQKLVPDVIEKYKSALDQAVKLTVRHNIPPVRGSTLILCNCTRDSRTKTVKSLGKTWKVSDFSLLNVLKNVQFLAFF